MGHKLYEGMPRTPRFKRVVALLGESAGGGGAIGVTAGGIEEIADATLAASEGGLQRAKVDEGLAYCVYLMAQITQAARKEDFVSALSDAGVSAPRETPVTGARYTVYDLIGSFTAAVDRHLQQSRSRNDISELAQLAASESLTALCRSRAETLFGSSQASVQESLRVLSTKKGFSTLTHDFFARLTRRYLEYHLSRELSNHVGAERRFANAGQYNKFLKQLDTYCRVATGPMRDFAGEWYSKHNFQRDLSLQKSRGFTAHAIDKVRGAMRYQERRDAD